MYREWKKNSPKSIIYESGNNKIESRSNNRWQDEVREDGRRVVREAWQEEVYNRKDWTKLLRPARNCRILHMPME
jgi:hypothetical protein